MAAPVRSVADLALSTRRANGYAATMPAAVSGQCGHATAFDAICRIREVSLTESVFEAAVEAYNARCQPQWSERELEHKKRDAATKHQLGEKFDAPPLAAEPATTHSADDIEAHIPDEQRFTDLGNAMRFAAAAKGRFLYVHAERKWLCFDGKRWVNDTAKRTHELAAVVARGLFHIAAKTKSPDEQRAISTHALRSQQAQAIDRMVRLVASALPDLKADPLEFDRDPDLLNVANGTVNLRTGELRAHRACDRITKLVPVVFDATAGAPTWEEFLESVQHDAETRMFLQRAVGYSATGHVGEHALFFLYGNGRNGKGTFTRAITNVLGDYVDVAPPGMLLASENAGHPTDVRDLMGKRLVTAAETGERSEWNEERVKWLTGGDKLKGRAMRENWEVFFDPTHKLWVESNHKPRVRGVDEGIWSRIKEIPFRQQWREATDDAPERAHLPVQDLELQEKLLRERPGILAWIVRGAQEWYANRLGTPREVREATAAYRRDEDLLGDFLASEQVSGLLLKDVHERYVRFAAVNDEQAMSPMKLRAELERRGMPSKRTNKGWVVQPAKLVTAGKAVAA
jgi:putative DNA primase/helicase